MEVGILIVKLSIGEANSLKEKRKIIKSLIDRLKNKYNLSVAETDLQNKWREAEIGIAIVGNEKPYLNRVLEKTVDIIEANNKTIMTDYEVHFW